MEHPNFPFVLLQLPKQNFLITNLALRHNFQSQVTLLVHQNDSIGSVSNVEKPHRLNSTFWKTAVCIPLSICARDGHL